MRPISQRTSRASPKTGNDSAVLQTKPFGTKCGCFICSDLISITPFGCPKLAWTMPRCLGTNKTCVIYRTSCENNLGGTRCCLTSYVGRFLGVPVLEKAGQKRSERVATSFRQVEAHFNNIAYCKVDLFRRPNISSKLSSNVSDREWVHFREK